jgi:hypothetical protein
MIAEVLLVMMFGSGPPMHQAQPAPAARPELPLVLQHLATFEMNARQAKAKTSTDGQALASLEKRYTEVSTAVDNWRTAAVSASDGASAQKNLEELSRTAARGLFEFGREARSYIEGRRVSADTKFIALIEERFIDAARALVATEGQDRHKLAANVACRPWGELR